MWKSVGRVCSEFELLMEESSSATFAVGIPLADCVEELVRFTLSYFLDGTLGAEIRLSRDYCLRLLQEDSRIADFPDVNLRENGELLDVLLCFSSSFNNLLKLKEI